MAKVLMLGIGGAGMRGLAYLLHAKGNEVWGTDMMLDKIRDDESLKDYRLVSEQEAMDNLGVFEEVIHTDAIEEDNAVIVKAHELGAKVMPYQEGLGDFAKGFKTMAVAGTHGKTSTTAMLGHILLETGVQPNILVGTQVPAWGNRNAVVGEDDVLVVEADEYRGHFLELEPEHAIVTSLDFDHPDAFADIDAVYENFNKFLGTVSGLVIVPETVYKKHAKVQWPNNKVIVSESLEGDVKNLPGEHMRMNAALAIRLAEELGVDKSDAEEAMKSFPGIGRRMEKLGEFNGVELISDYGHHPAEIAATLKGAKEKFKGKKIAVMWEPHTLERVKAFGDDFVKSLGQAEAVILVPVFVPAGREDTERDEAREALGRLEGELASAGMTVRKIDGFDVIKDAILGLSDIDVYIAFTAGVLDRHLRSIVNNR